MEKGPILKSSWENLFHLPHDDSAAGYILRKCEQFSQLDLPCLMDPNSGDVLQYRDVEPMSRSVASYLHRRGFRKGDILVSISHHGTRLHVFFLGVWRLGGIVHCSYPDDESNVLAERIWESGARFLLCDPENEEKCLQAVTSIPSSGDNRPEVLVFGHNHSRSISAYSIFAMKSNENHYPDPSVRRDDIALLLPTSGTTGGSKAVIYTHETLLWNVILFEKFPFRRGKEQALTLITGKQTHFTGSVCPLAMMTTGRPLLMMKNVSQETIFRAIHNYKVTSIFSFPSFLTGLVNHPNASRYDLSSIEAIFTAGMVVGEPFVKTLSQLPNVKYITSIYGMTEAGFLMSNVSWKKSGGELVCVLDERRDPSRGKLPPGAMLRVRSLDSGEFLGPGEQGELCFKNHLVCRTYWRNPEETAQTFHDGWINTGDLGYYDACGSVYVVNRVKEVFKYYNNHITPSEIEGVLCGHPAVDEACVVGVDDPEGGGSVPRAFITLRSADHVTDAEKILHQVNQHLAPYKKLRGGLYILQDFPRGKSGKILRQILAAMNPGTLFS